MTNESISNMCDLWQSQPGEPRRFSPEDLRSKASKFERTIARRNMREYVAAGVVIVVFAYYAWIFPALLLRIGCGLTIAGTLYMVYQLHRRASARTAPADLALLSCIEFQQRELERQRDALRSVWSWYLLPFIPGISVFLPGLFQFALRKAHADGRPFQAAHVVVSLAAIAIFTVAVFVAVWLLNRWAAGKLQAQIDELTVLKQELE